ncbi:M48 family metalloprotease [Methylophilus aquaticus]|uniref:M48 family metalloprotease n=1 Tax=Methylophilus aquaticus TaxID=1971610 RepID=A0ABT9JUM8_9PROT|nr:M48 family metalloprotease [Methylophilus aquaticus]MDP8568267.1 M48 family metalloprotease [Methylophilus aquaticus]
MLRRHKKAIAITLASTLLSCGVNPVTKQREFQFVSQDKEIQIGQQNYSPARQSQGGDYTLDPELTRYVQQVGQKLAVVSDRPDLPYEFVVLNDSVPNAWAMPGGKIAFNRGLLYELHSEAELAAVLGHEIVHAAARHGAKGMERGIFMQGAMLAVGLATRDSNYANLVVGGAQLGGQLITSKYGRDAESEADTYGMKYMKLAGYDPSAAVTLQETFVRLSEGKRQDFISGLFASHPPSQERVDENKKTLVELGAGGEMGKDIYAEKMSKLMATREAYKAYDEGKAALQKGDAEKAKALAKKALRIEPREARFQELLGDVALTNKNTTEALAFYDKAIQLQPDYFKPYVQSGIALFNDGKKTQAEPFLKKANALLPTAPGYALLGQIAEGRGETTLALQHYQLAASSDSDIGKESAARAMRIDLPRNPARYLPSGPVADNSGLVFAAVQNNSSVPVGRVQVRMLQYDGRGVVINQTRAMLITGGIAPGKRGMVATGFRILDQQALQNFKVIVEGAELAK